MKSKIVMEYNAFNEPDNLKILLCDECPSEKPLDHAMAGTIRQYLAVTLEDKDGAESHTLQGHVYREGNGIYVDVSSSLQRFPVAHIVDAFRSAWRKEKERLYELDLDLKTLDAMKQYKGNA